MRGARRWTLLNHEHCPLILIVEGDTLTEIHFGRNEPADAQHVETDLVLDEAMRQLRLYFSGELREFHLPLNPQGTSFQKRVWDALLRIPHGETRSYSDIAKQIGSPEAVRAVGAANGRNPLPVVIPCHRVIGASGKLTGFGGGLPKTLSPGPRTQPSAAVRERWQLTTPGSVAELENLLSAPTEADVRALAALSGDLLILGAGGKMGPSLAGRARRALNAANVRKRVIAVSRFSNPELQAELLRDGIEVIGGDLLSPGFLESLGH